MEHIAYQVKAGLFGVDAALLRKCVIAYEPIWAIGTGKTATAEEAQEVCEGIRAQIRRLYGARPARAISILYGGSMDKLAYDETMADWRTHDGIDIAAADGTAVKAVHAGKVESVGEDDLYGVVVVIDQGNGVKTTYADLRSTPAVKTGDTVAAGDVIGYLGNTAICETAEGPHLHLSMKKRKPIATVGLYLFVFVVCIVTLYPYFVTFVTASKSTTEMYAADMTVFPKVWQWSNFVDIWSKAPVLKYLVNSIIVAAGSTGLAILCGVPAAYAMRLTPPRDGGNYWRDGAGECWRMYDFVENSICLQSPETDRDFYESAIAFGGFQQKMEDFDAATLHETIPNFHNTPDRYRQFKETLLADPLGRCGEVGPEIEFVLAREAEAGTLRRMLERGELPLRVTHNDTKLNNVMRIIRTRDYKQMSRDAANIISAQVILKPDSVLGLATGSSPLGAYEQLIEWYVKGDLDFSRVSTVNLDEYVGLGFDNRESYRRFMTGGQMAPTTLVGQKTTTSPYGRDEAWCGAPIRISEMLSTIPGSYYIERCAVNNTANIIKCKAAIKKAFRYQMEGKGFTMRFQVQQRQRCG